MPTTTTANRSFLGEATADLAEQISTGPALPVRGITMSGAHALASVLLLEDQRAARAVIASRDPQEFASVEETISIMGHDMGLEGCPDARACQNILVGLLADLAKAVTDGELTATFMTADQASALAFVLVAAGYPQTAEALIARRLDDPARRRPRGHAAR